MEHKEELLKPKIDVVFHSLFRKGNERITKALISSITKEKIEDIELDNDRFIIGKYPEEKLGILDLKAKLNNGTICDIEIQLADNKDTAERFLYYWSRVYTSQLLKGNTYKELNRVIGIIVIDYNFEKTKEIEQISTKWKIKEVTTGKELVLTDMLELYIIEVPKVKKILEKEPNNNLAQWIQFLDNPNEKEVLKSMENNEEIKEAMEELEVISKEKELRRLAELKEKAIRDEKNALAHAIEDGKNIGIAEGRKEGLKEGLKEVNKKLKDEKIEIAKRLLKIGLTVEQITEVTELSKQEISSLL